MFVNSRVFLFKQSTKKLIIEMNEGVNMSGKRNKNWNVFKIYKLVSLIETVLGSRKLHNSNFSNALLFTPRYLECAKKHIYGQREKDMRGGIISIQTFQQHFTCSFLRA